MPGEVVHCKRGKPFDLYVGRPTIYGNPWSHKFGTGAQFIVKDVETAVRCYEDWLEGRKFIDILQDERQKVISAYPQLAGKTLSCWCEPDKPCHAKVLARLSSKYVNRDHGAETDPLEGNPPSL